MLRYMIFIHNNYKDQSMPRMSTYLVNKVIRPGLKESANFMCWRAYGNSSQMSFLFTFNTSLRCNILKTIEFFIKGSTRNRLIILKMNSSSSVNLFFRLRTQNLQCLGRVTNCSLTSCSIISFHDVILARITHWWWCVGCLRDFQKDSQLEQVVSLVTNHSHNSRIYVSRTDADFYPLRYNNNNN